jgi:hypothetical protein
MALSGADACGIPLKKFRKIWIGLIAFAPRAIASSRRFLKPRLREIVGPTVTLKCSQGEVIMKSTTSLSNDRRHPPSPEPGPSRRAFFTRTALAGLGGYAMLAPPYKAANAAVSTATADSGEETDLRQPVVNVRDFGAKGDGVTDDTAKIQKAVDSLAGRSGTVFFPAGIYLISKTPSGWCLLLRSRVDYVGEGPVSKLLLAPQQGNNAYMMSTINSATSREITIRRLHFDGNHASQGAAFELQEAIYLPDVEDCLVEECLFHDTGGDAVKVSGKRVVIEHNEMHSLNGAGVYLQGVSNSIVRGNFIHDSKGLSLSQLEQGPPSSGNKYIGNFVCRSGGFKLGGAGDRRNLSDVLIADNNFCMTNATTTPAVDLYEVSQIEIVRNNIWQLTGGIQLRSSQDVTIKNNSIRDALSAGPGSSAIVVYSEVSDGTLPYSERITIAGNEISDNAMTGCTIRHSNNAVVKDNLILNNADGGILVHKGARYSHFSGNKVLANAAGGILVDSDAGTGNEFGTSTRCGLNSIQGNGVFGLKNGSGFTIQAVGNYWGCAAGPGNLGCDTVLGPGPVVFKPLLGQCHS